MKKIVSLFLSGVVSIVVLPSPTPVSAVGTLGGWPTCTSDAQVECVESLTYTTANGTFNAIDPGGELPPLAPMVQRTDPYVKVLSPNSNIAGSTLSFLVLSPQTREIAPNVLQGLDEGTYSFVIRLGSYDPTQTGLSAEPISVSTAQRSDGTFTLSVTAKPKPRVMVMSAASHAACKAGGWTCQGEHGTVRNLTGFVFQNPLAEYRPLFRGMWVATNASEFSIPSLSLLERKISAQIAGPHTVPSGFPTEGLSMEDGKGINPAFYKFHVPFSALEGMLSMAPSEIRNSITPEMIKASITDAGTQKEQAVTLASDDKGVTIDLGLTHFSAPNPVVTFYTPAQVAASNQLLTAARFLKGKSYAVSRLVKISSGYKVSKIVIGSSAKSICTATGTKIKMKKKGTCVFTVTSRKTIRSKTTTKIIKGKISVS